MLPLSLSLIRSASSRVSSGDLAAVGAILFIGSVKSKPIGCVMVPPDLGDKFTQPWNQTFADSWVQMSPSQTFVKFKGCQNILFTLPWSKDICSADVEGIDPSTDDEIGEMLKISLPSPTHPFFTAQIVLMCKC